jgi:hypothetical protein
MASAVGRDRCNAVHADPKHPFEARQTVLVLYSLYQQ